MTPEQHNQFLYFYSTVPQFLAAFLGFSSIFYFFLINKMRDNIFWISNYIYKSSNSYTLSKAFREKMNQVKLFNELKSIQLMKKTLMEIKKEGFSDELKTGRLGVVAKNRFESGMNKAIGGIDQLYRLARYLYLSLAFGLAASIISIISLLILDQFCAQIYFCLSLFVAFFTGVAIYYMIRIIGKSFK